MFKPKINAKNKLVIKENNIPPNKPSSVLFGLIVLSNFLLPNNLPNIYEKISNEIITTIRRLNLRKFKLSKFIKNKEEEEIIKYKNMKNLYLLKNK